MSARARHTELTEAPARGAPRRRLVTLVRMRRLSALVLLLLPAAAVLLHDFARRGDRIAHFGAGGLAFYAASSAAGALFWGSLMVLAARRRGPVRWAARSLVVAGAAAAVGAQAYTFTRYAVYMDHQAVLVGTSMLPSIGQQLWDDRVTFALSLLPPLVVALALPFVLRGIAPPRGVPLRRAADLAVIAFLLVTQIDPGRGAEQGQPPDVLYLSAMGQLARAKWDKNEMVERMHPGPRTPIPVPKLQAKPKRPRDVLFVVTESVRAQAVCVAPVARETCKTTPFSNEAAPNRMPIEGMHSLDSTTAISLAILWSGLAPGASRADLHSSPLVWEYAHAAGIDTAYWTSQNLLFGNSGKWLEGIPVSKMVSATQIEPGATLEIGADDGELVRVAMSELPALRSPFFGVVHLSNTHFPYKIDNEDYPFLAASHDDSDEAVTRNRYHDAVYFQDKAVANLIKTVRSRPGGERTVIVFTSDHGEQLREKGAVGHTGTLFEEEIRVPFWMDAPPGTLDDAERASLASLAKRPVTHLDVLPTLLDLVGVWDAPELAPFKAKLPGQSLLRGGTDATKIVALTNCSELWQCAFKNWGAMQGSRKLVATQGDHDWRCFDIAEDPHEEHDLGREACGPALLDVAEHPRGRPFK